MLNIEVCVGTSCYLRGSYHIINRLEELTEEAKLSDKVNISSIFCLGNCGTSTSVRVNGEVLSATIDGVDEFFKNNILPLAQKN